jgi:hypothetical protein
MLAVKVMNRSRTSLCHGNWVAFYVLEHHDQQNELPIALVVFAGISFSGFILPVSVLLLPAPNPRLIHPQIAPSLLVATFYWSVDHLPLLHRVDMLPLQCRSSETFGYNDLDSSHRSSGDRGRYLSLTVAVPAAQVNEHHDGQYLLTSLGLPYSATSSHNKS